MGLLYLYPYLHSDFNNSDMYTFTYLLLGAVLFDKLTVSQIVKKFPAFYGTRRFINALTTARHMSLLWARSIKCMPPPPPSQFLKIHLDIILPPTPGFWYVRNLIYSFLSWIFITLYICKHKLFLYQPKPRPNTWLVTLSEVTDGRKLCIIRKESIKNRHLLFKNIEIQNQRENGTYFFAKQCASYFPTSCHNYVHITSTQQTNIIWKP